MKKLFIIIALITVGIFYSFELSNIEFLVQKKPLDEVQRRFNSDLNELIRLIEYADINHLEYTHSLTICHD